MSERIASVDLELGTVTADIYQPPAGYNAVVTTLNFHNTSAATRTVHLFFKSKRSIIKIRQFEVVSNGAYVDDTGWTLTGDDRLCAHADDAGVTCKVNMTEVSDA